MSGEIARLGQDRADVFLILGQKIHALETALAESVARERTTAFKLRWIEDAVVSFMLVFRQREAQREQLLSEVATLASIVNDVMTRRASAARRV